jgi:EmrB/QacA subfamily drug resistance transporter
MPVVHPPHPRLTIAVACLATAMLMLDISVVNTALSDIAAGLDTDLHGLQWVIDAYTLPLAATVLTAGALADRLGRRRLFVAGLAVFTVASAACGLSGTIGQLVAARAVQGLGASILFAVSLSLIAQVTQSPAARGRAMAAYGATVGAAFALGPFIGGALTSGIGWRAIFLVNVPIGIAAIAVTLSRVTESRDPRAARVDVPGQVTLVGGLFLLVLGLLQGNEAGWGSARIVATFAGAGALLGAFAIVELRRAEPMLPLGLLRRPAFAGAQLAAFAMAGSFFSIFVYVTLYLQGVLGLSPLETGLVYLPGTFLLFVVSGASAPLAERVSPGPLIGAGLALTAAGMLWMLVADVDSRWTTMLPGFLVTCLGTGLFNPAAANAALNALPPQRSGLAAGVNDTFRQTAMAVGIAGLGTLVPAGAAFGTTRAQHAAYVAGLHDALWVAAALAAVGAVGSAVLLSRGVAATGTEPRAAEAA